MDYPLLGFRRSALRRLLPMFTESTTICLSAFITSTYYTRIVIIQQREAPDRFHPLPGSRSRCTLYRDWRASVRSSGCVYPHGSCVQLYCTERTAGKHVAGACYSPGGERGVDRLGGVPLGSCLVRSSASVHVPALRAPVCCTHANHVVLLGLACACSVQVPVRHACAVMWWVGVSPDFYSLCVLLICAGRW